MPATGSGTKHAVGPQHHGQCARQNKRRQEFGERRSTRFETGRREEKRIELGAPAPPTPTQDKIVKLERAARGANPTCLHFWIEKDARQFLPLHPDHFFCGHCNDCVEAMTRSMNKKAIKRDSKNFVCQGGHHSQLHHSNNLERRKTILAPFHRRRRGGEC
jgi:hypothetical protein